MSPQQSPLPPGRDDGSGPAGSNGDRGSFPAAPFVWGIVAWMLPIAVFGVVGSLSTRELGEAVARPVAFLCAFPAGVAVVLGLFAKGRPVWCALGVVLGAAYLVLGLIVLVIG